MPAITPPRADRLIGIDRDFHAYQPKIRIHPSSRLKM